MRSARFIDFVQIGRAKPRLVLEFAFTLYIRKIITIKACVHTFIGIVFIHLIYQILPGEELVLIY